MWVLRGKIHGCRRTVPTFAKGTSVLPSVRCWRPQPVLRILLGAGPSFSDRAFPLRGGRVRWQSAHGRLSDWNRSQRFAQFHFLILFMKAVLRARSVKYNFDSILFYIGQYNLSTITDVDYLGLLYFAVCSCIKNLSLESAVWFDNST